jgi:molybdate transport system permease protein
VTLPDTHALLARLTAEEWQVVLLTLRVAGLAVGCGLPLAILTGALLAVRFPGRFLISALVHLPLALPPVVTGWLLLLMFGVEGPAGGWLFRHFNIRLAFTMQGAALACGVMVFPLMVRAVRLSIELIDPGLSQAARTLGAGRIDRFFSIMLPLSLPGVLMAAVLGFTGSLGEFGAVITFAANIPGQTQTLPLAIYAALQTSDGALMAARLSLMSVALALGGVLLSERLASRLRRRV